AMQYPKEEDAEGCMRVDIIEELIKEVQQEEAIRKFQAAHERYNVLKDTNKDLVLQEIHEIVQETDPEEVQP
ncbi:hypothetical protein PIB30_098234, partial [Stylosanthes scabra]|nr:hypothetical protein [Stylosanthes scabra]